MFDRPGLVLGVQEGAASGEPFVENGEQLLAGGNQPGDLGHKDERIPEPAYTETALRAVCIGLLPIVLREQLTRRAAR